MFVMTGRLNVRVGSYTKQCFRRFGVSSKFRMAADSDVVAERFDDIIKSEQDTRLYRGLVLRNRMRVLLISDADTDKSAAALSVNVGSMSDPVELPGLAHLCEHMLFLGTEKYPDENEYLRYITEHGGTRNASTSTDRTMYHFDIQPEFFTGALDRFAQFFLQPLFTPSATEREINAVDAEHAKNVPVDGRRLQRVLRHMAADGHAYRKFGTGNKTTLAVLPQAQRINVRDALLKFHGEWYSANLMCLTVLGREDLDSLQAIVSELFGAVVDKDCAPPTWDMEPYGPQHMRTCIKLLPVKDLRELRMYFPSPYLAEFYESTPEGYILSMLNDEGVGSIPSTLDARNWSTHFHAQHSSPYHGFSMFCIIVSLTEDGAANTDEIIRIVFQYINRMKQEPPSKKYHDELSSLSAVRFCYKDKTPARGYCNYLTPSLRRVPMRHILTRHHLLTEWRPDIITNILNAFTADNLRVVLINKDFADIVDREVPWFGAKFCIAPLAEAKISEWRQASLDDALQLPEANEFVPEVFDLHPIETDSDSCPCLIKDSMTRVWMQQDDVFRLPKTHLRFYVRSPWMYLDPINWCCGDILLRLLEDQMEADTYKAQLAGLRWNVHCTKMGLIFQLNGFTHKLELLLKKILASVSSLTTIEPDKFMIFKEESLRHLRNLENEQPFEQSVTQVKQLLRAIAWSRSECIAVHHLITVKLMEDFVVQLFAKISIECLIHGNTNRAASLQIADTIEQHLRAAPLNAAPLVSQSGCALREIVLEPLQTYHYSLHNPVHSASCTNLHFQCGVQTYATNVALEMFRQLIAEPCFNQLRTKEQLGYRVRASIVRSTGAHGLSVIVQSGRHPVYVEQRIEAFLADMLTMIKSMPEEDFETHRNALIARRVRKPNNIGEITARLWREIMQQAYRFDREEMEVAQLQALQPEELVRTCGEWFAVDGVKRRKMAVFVLPTWEHMRYTDAVVQQYDEYTKHVRLIPDIAVFKNAHGLYALRMCDDDDDGRIEVGCSTEGTA